MKYNYSIEFLDMGGQKDFYFRLPSELSAVEIFINSDIQSEYMRKKVKDECLQVQNGELEEISFNSNNCSTTIRPDYTTIKDRYSEINNIFTIETSELILLIDAYIEEKKKNSI